MYLLRHREPRALAVPRLPLARPYDRIAVYL